MDFLTGNLLIAMPELADTNFYRSVSFIFHHDEEGAAGVILNRPSNTTVSDVWDDLEGDAVKSRSIHVGGPVEGPLIALHTSLVLGERQIMPGVFLSLGRNNLSSLVSQTVQQVKIFSGYAGWGPQQLEAEIHAGGWLTFPCDFDDVFDTPEEIWKTACTKAGNEIMFSHQSSSEIQSIDPLAN